MGEWHGEGDIGELFIVFVYNASGMQAAWDVAALPMQGDGTCGERARTGQCGATDWIQNVHVRHSRLLQQLHDIGQDAHRSHRSASTGALDN
jgi:hypothetical protein